MLAHGEVQQDFVRGRQPWTLSRSPEVICRDDSWVPSKLPLAFASHPERGVCSFAKEYGQCCQIEAFVFLQEVLGV